MSGASVRPPSSALSRFARCGLGVLVLVFFLFFLSLSRLRLRSLSSHCNLDFIFILISFTVLRKGVCVCVYHLNGRKASYSCRGHGSLSLAMPTKLWDSAGWECGRTFPHLQIYNIVPSLGAYQAQLVGTYISYRCSYLWTWTPVIIILSVDKSFFFHFFTLMLNVFLHI